jgi:hypothetical protein
MCQAASGRCAPGTRLLRESRLKLLQRRHRVLDAISLAGVAALDAAGTAADTRTLVGITGGKASTANASDRLWAKYPRGERFAQWSRFVRDPR